MVKKEFIPINKIVVNGKPCDPAKVAEISKSIGKRGMDTPIDVTVDGEKYILTDGRYRITVMKELGQTHIYARINNVNELDEITVSR